MKTQKTFVLLAVLMTGCLSLGASTQWVSISGGIPDLNIQAAAVDAKNPRIIFAGSEKAVYRTEDGGINWKKVLGIRGSGNQVNLIYTDVSQGGGVYVGTDRSLHYSADGGKKWIVLFDGKSGNAKKVLCVAKRKSEPSQCWIGTSGGLFVWNERKREMSPVNAFSDTEVYSILLYDQGPVYALLASRKGVYRNQSVSMDSGWECVYATSREEKKGESEATLEQFSVEEFTPAPYASLAASGGEFYASTAQGILKAGAEANSWQVLKGQNLPDRHVEAVIGSSKTLYVATKRGIFQWDGEKELFGEVYKGLEGKEARNLFYSASGDYILAATSSGLYKLSYPELGVSGAKLNIPAPNPSPELNNIKEIFSHEPSIQEVQKAAVNYAEVHPKKIEDWRKAASLKAWLPTVSVDAGVSRNQNVDLDRGGTGDPDRFIIGPEEKGFDWSVGVNWDLGEIIWNNDQTSIDTRSKLMVELRDDILNEVTHFYYERRRLKAEMALAPPRDPAIQIEKQIRLEELTAHIDALTGGLFSKDMEKSKV